MILVDKRILAGGIAMVVVGLAISFYLDAIIPLGMPGMTDDEAAQLILEQRENQDYTTLAGLLVGVGFLLVLISFGARRRHRGGALKTEKKPA